MKGKIYRYDPGTKKVLEVLRTTAKEIPYFNVPKDENGPTAGMLIGPGGALLKVPTADSESQQRKNLASVLDKAEDCAEEFDDRRDTLHVQGVIQRMREHYLG